MGLKRFLELDQGDASASDLAFPRDSEVDPVEAEPTSAAGRAVDALSVLAKMVVAVLALGVCVGISVIAWIQQYTCQSFSGILMDLRCEYRGVMWSVGFVAFCAMLGAGWGSLAGTLAGRSKPIDAIVAGVASFAIATWVLLSHTPWLS